MSVVSFVLALVIPAQPLVDADVLEPSVRNEVDHALNVAPTNVVPFCRLPADVRLFCTTNDVFGTNGLTQTDVAIKLISSQRSDGHWRVGTNDVTSAALEILKRLQGRIQAEKGEGTWK